LLQTFFCRFEAMRSALSAMRLTVYSESMLSDILMSSFSGPLSTTFME
jgi:hypothetical protein